MRSNDFHTLSFRPISSNLFGQAAEGYDQLLIQEQPKSEIEIEMNDFSVREKTSWVEIYDETSLVMQKLKTKSKTCVKVVDELRHLQHSRSIPKFNEDNKLLDKKIAACTSEVYAVRRALTE